MNRTFRRRELLLGICTVTLSLLLIAGYTAPVLANPDPVLQGSGDAGRFDEMMVGFPWIIKDGNTYKMWYSGWNATSMMVFNVTIGYATAPDGLHWTRYDGSETGESVLALGSGTAWDNSSVLAPCVIKEGASDYKMWYSGWNGTNFQIGYATSSDGTTWTKSGSTPVLSQGSSGQFDDTHVAISCVIKDGAIYKMWYSGFDGSTWRIGYTTSNDGINWGITQQVMDVGGSGQFDSSAVYMPCVNKTAVGTYKMWYTGNDGSRDTIGYATSNDGITWGSRQQVLDLGPSGDWDDGDLARPCVIPGSYEMWYAGDDTSGDGGMSAIGYAISDNGIDWTRVAFPEFQIGALGFLTMLILTMGVVVPVTVRLVYKNKKKEK
jgi:hypothetical protein